MSSDESMAPCEWPVDEGCLPVIPDESGSETGQATLDAAVALAVQVLWALSGRQYGVCEAVVRPCPERYSHTRGYGRTGLSEITTWTEVRWMLAGCGCAGRCTYSGPGRVHLPGPVQGIIEVLVDGVVLDESEYTLEGNVLYRVGGTSSTGWVGGYWPAQDLSLPATEPGTWQVTYARGNPAPAGVGQFTATLASEFYNACTGERCRLPRTVTEASARGVNFRMFNPQDIYNSGKTGLPEVDLWLAAVNPNKLMAPPAVL